MTLAILIFFAVVVAPVFTGRRGSGPADVPVVRTVVGPSAEGWDPRLDRIGLWVLAAVALILIAYGPFLLSYLPPNAVSPGFTRF